MTSWHDMIPVPLAAPETKELLAARFRVIAAGLVLAAALLFLGELRQLIGSAALPSLAAASTFLAVQGWAWARLKNAADDAWLFRETDDVA